MNNFCVQIFGSKGGTSKGEESTRLGELLGRIVSDHKVRGGIALTVFVVSVIVALALVPGMMGTVGSFTSEVPVFTQITQALGLPGVIALDVAGGTALLVALGTMIWTVYELCKSCSSTKNEKSRRTASVKKKVTIDPTSVPSYQMEYKFNGDLSKEDLNSKFSQKYSNKSYGVVRIKLFQEDTPLNETSCMTYMEVGQKYACFWHDADGNFQFGSCYTENDAREHVASNHVSS